MFSIPRDYTDGFVMWVKQVVANCLTAFLQSTMLVCGLLVFRENFLLGLGVMLAAGEIPSIAGAFGLETTTRVNVQSVVYTAQSAVNLTKTIKAVAFLYVRVDDTSVMEFLKYSVRYFITQKQMFIWACNVKEGMV